jgi:myo-inositol 2-dehydrogenase / D-chiro-inositol 1-dehydrogenase
MADSGKRVQAVDGFGRREFFRLTTAGLALGAPFAAAAPNAPVKFGLIGCGGRGVHDATTMVSEAGAQLVSLADLFEDKLAPAKQRLDAVLEKRQFPNIASDRLYHGPDAAARLANSDVDAVLIAITPYFYPQVLDAVSASGKHIYSEKPVATDVAGCLRVIDLAKRLDGKIVWHVGLQVPWAAAMQEMNRRIEAGAIGRIVTAQSFFYFGGGARSAPAGVSPAEARLRTWAGDRILSGDIVVEQNVHGLDKMNWILKSHPVSAVAKGDRKARTDFGDVWDHFLAELTYPSGVTVSFHSTQFLKGWMDAGERFFGTRGTSESHYTGGVRIYGEEPWDSGVNDIIADAERNKFRAFVDDVRNKNFHNEAFRGAESTLTAILVRTAAYQGREITWDAVISSNEEWDPHIDLKKL